jgi:hypothetical protein
MNNITSASSSNSLIQVSLDSYMHFDGVTYANSRAQLFSLLASSGHIKGLIIQNYNSFRYLMRFEQVTNMTAENWDLKNTDARRGPVRISDSYIHAIKNSTFDDSSGFFLYMLRTTVGIIEDVEISK